MKTTLLLCAALVSLTVVALAQPSRPRPATTVQLLVQGIWAASQEGNAEFWVAGSRLTYVEWPNQHMRYHITPTTLTIMQADGPYICRIRKLTRDSLVYVTPAGFMARLYKRK